MLEKLADHDDALLEQLLMDEVPDRETVFADLAKETGAAPDRAGPVRLGAERLRRPPAAEGAAPRGARARQPRPSGSAPTGGCAFVFKVCHGGAMGRLSYARVFGGSLKEGAELQEQRRRAMPRRHPVRAPGREDGEARRGRGRRRRRHRQARRRPCRRMAGGGKAPPAPDVAAADAQLRARHRDQGPQGRRPPVDRAPQADRGGSRAATGSRTRRCTRRGSGASTTSISRSRWSG